MVIINASWHRFAADARPIRPVDPQLRWWHAKSYFWDLAGAGIGQPAHLTPSLTGLKFYGLPK
jgi:hypothetical protein